MPLPPGAVETRHPAHSGVPGRRHVPPPFRQGQQRTGTATRAASAALDRFSRKSDARSACSNGRSGSFRRWDIGHLAGQPAAIVAHPEANDPRTPPLGRVGRQNPLKIKSL